MGPVLSRAGFRPPVLLAASIGLVLGATTPRHAPYAPAAGGEPGVPAPVSRQVAGFDRGAPDAPVTVLEFADFGCGACAFFAREIFPALDAEFVATGRVRWTFVPFVTGSFPNSAQATRAAACVGPDSFWDMHERIYHERTSWMRTRNPAAIFARLAAETEHDTTAFLSCYDADAAGARDLIRRNNRAAAGRRVRGTPTFFIGERRIVGAVPLAAFRDAILAALEDAARAGEPKSPVPD